MFRHISETLFGPFLLTYRLTQTQKRTDVDVLSYYYYGSTLYLHNTTVTIEPKSTTKKNSNLFLYDQTYYGLKKQEVTNQEK